MLTVGTILLSITPKTIKDESETARQQGKADNRWSKWYITIQIFCEVIFKTNFKKVLDKIVNNSFSQITAEKTPHIYSELVVKDLQFWKFQIQCQ